MLVRNPYVYGPQPLGGDPPPSRPQYLLRTALQALEKERQLSYLKSQHATEFRLLFNIDANTAMNARKYDTWLYLIKPYSILGFWVYRSCLYIKTIL